VCFAYLIILCSATGCFWGIELAFQRVPGVVKTEVVS
jgi:peptide methionine sulfoxide reductase MsrA